MIRRLCFAALFLLFAFVLFASNVQASPLFPGDISVSISATDDPESVVTTLQVLFLFSLIALSPSLLLMLTGFLRIIIMFSFVRQAMATQQMPPNQVLIGIALFLTIFLMTPTLTEINENAMGPFGAGEISMDEAIEAGMAPIRRFMMAQLDSAIGQDAITLFFDLADEEPVPPEELGNHILIPAFILHELSIGFILGFMIYLPFIVIDMVVASTLMALGMMMLPPMMISLPFKVMTFLLAGGWTYVIEHLLQTFVPP